MGINLDLNGIWRVLYSLQDEVVYRWNDLHEPAVKELWDISEVLKSLKYPKLYNKIILMSHGFNFWRWYERPLKTLKPGRLVPETAATALKMIHLYSEQTQSESQKLKTKIIVLGLKNSQLTNSQPCSGRFSSLGWVLELLPHLKRGAHNILEM